MYVPHGDNVYIAMLHTALILDVLYIIYVKQKKCCSMLIYNRYGALMHNMAKKKILHM